MSETKTSLTDEQIKIIAEKLDVDYTGLSVKRYTERAVDKHPKIWQNINNKTRKEKRL